MAAFESNARRSNFNLSPKSLVYRTSHLPARMSVESTGQHHPRLGVRRRSVFDLDCHFGVIAHASEGLGEFEHILLGEVLRFDRSGHAHRITANLKTNRSRDRSRIAECLQKNI